MKILLINKFLHPNGGSETYIFKLGQALIRMNHEVQFFGMEHENRCVGNAAGAYTSKMDFHTSNALKKLTYSIKTIYSLEARRKIRIVLDAFCPDVCHLNNFNYQLTPSILLEIRKWERESGHKVKIIFTAHDYQLICPNHMLRNPTTQENCEKCLEGGFGNCTKGRCVHGSRTRSTIGTLEAIFWKRMGVYRQIDTIICPTRFMKSRMDRNPVFREKTVVMHNFVETRNWQDVEKKDYVLYFGRFSGEKGIETLLSVCRELPQVFFVFAGSGPMEDKLQNIPNIRNVGFQTGDALAQLIRQARFTIYPSEWYENCPFSVMESQQYGTPVLGANIGGIPELIDAGRTGVLFESGNAAALKAEILALWENRDLTDRYSQNCRQLSFDTPQRYCEKLMQYYQSPPAEV